MNNPKDKAKELFRSFRFAIGITLDSPQEAHDVSKQCALVCVVELIAQEMGEYAKQVNIDYLLEVKSEIEKL